MSDELREEIARAVARLKHHDGDVESDVQSRVDFVWMEYLPEADAILPIIARVREEAYAKGMEIGGEMAQREADYS